MPMCLYCGDSFTTDRTDKLYCSKRCKSYAGHRKKAESMGELCCETCGANYRPIWPSQKRFCSKSCELRLSHKNRIASCASCIDCGSEYMRKRSDDLRCDLCWNAKRSKDNTRYKAAKDPSIQVGVGSGYGQHYDPAKGGNTPGKNSYRAKAFAAGKSCCILCGFKAESLDLCVHHINHDRTDHQLSNLAILCHNCHFRLHRIIKQRIRAGEKHSPELCVSVFKDAEVKSRNKAGKSGGG